MKDLDLNKSPNLRASSASYTGGSGGSLGDASMADLKQGYVRGEHSHDAWGFFGEPDQYEQQGSARERGGFLTRPQGEER